MRVLTEYSASVQVRLTTKDYLIMSETERISWLEEYRGKREHLQQPKSREKKEPLTPLQLAEQEVAKAEKAALKAAAKSQPKAGKKHNISVDDIE